MTNNLKLKNYSIGNEIDAIEIDFQELLSRSVVDCTINKVIFEEKKIDIPIHWKDFVEKINEYNDLERLLKTDVKNKSKYGKNYVGFDMFQGFPIIWFADIDESNNAVRINGMNEFAVQVVRTYATIKGNTPLLRNRIVYTNQTRSVLFQGGFGLGKNEKDEWEDEKGNVYSEEKISQASFPLDWVSITTPQYILDNFENGNIKHGFGVIPCLEFLNKDVLDININDAHLNDWYTAKEYIPLINAYLKFFAWELNLDHTRVLGQFSNQDNKNIINSNKIKTPQKIQQELMDAKHTYLETGTDKVIKQKLILRSLGGETSLDIMNSTLRGNEHIKALGEILDLAYKICGYSWGSEENAVYENVSQTQNSNKRVYETTKEKIELFTRQWKKMFVNIAFVVFKEQGVYKSINEVRREFEKYVDFKIISNILQEQNNDWKKTIEIFQAGLLPKEKALEFIFPDMKQDEINELVNKLSKEDEKKKIDKESQFQNENPFGSEEDKNNNDLTEKEPK